MSNLLYALTSTDTAAATPVIFAGEKTDRNILALYARYAGIIEHSMFDMGSSGWLLNRIVARLSGRELLLMRLLRKEGISVMSHLSYGVKGSSDCKTVGWIPDFQHLHLPEMFSKHEISGRDRCYEEMAARCDRIILSSMDARNDFCRIAPAHSQKARVLHFTSQPDSVAYKADRNSVESKFGLGEKYFYLPNQFWKHKNHAMVFESVRILKERKKNILLVCSGFMDDSRNRGHVAGLIDFIRIHKLEENIRLLGMVDRHSLFCLMRNCISVINPSLFEGWSTTVEEARSLGKNLILSDIRVHREQDPPASIYFDPYDPERLADILDLKWTESPGGPDIELESAAMEGLPVRTRRFGEAYMEIIMELCGRGGV